MTQFVKTHQPCPCGNSSDAYSIAADGHGYCFSCSSIFPGVSDFTDTRTIEEDDTPTSPTVYSEEYLPWRGISTGTMRYYDVRTKVDSTGKPRSIGFPYGGGEATKHRLIDEKKLWSEGLIGKCGLFGQDRFSAGQSKSVTITEGEIDCLSAYQMLGSKYPVVSVQSASSALRDCTRAYEWLNQFERIYLAFDNDKPGDKALKAVASLFNYNKVYHVKLSLKDANEYLQADKGKEFVSIWYNARRYLPDNILSSLSDFKDALRESKKDTGISFPFPCLQEKTLGLRKGEVTLFTAPEGVGKTEILRAIEYHILKTTGSNLAIIHLEENKVRSLKGLVGYELAKPAHLPTSGVTDEEIEATLDKLVVRDDRLYVYSHFGSDDPDTILSTIRFLVSACGCEYVFLDHISIVVSGRNEDDERKTLDYLSTRLAMLVEELNFALVLVSHVNDEGKTRGSRNVSKIANTWIHLDRNLEAETEKDRNTTKLVIKKNRFASYTGPVGKLIFNPQSFILTDESEVFDLPNV